RTQVSNASRTLCLNLASVDWDERMCALLRVPREVLPTIVDSSGPCGETSDLGWLPGGIPIAGIAGDQQAALFGQACFKPGEAKNTYGTGCFALANTGERPVTSSHGLLTTIAWRIGGRTTYALEGAVFVAGAAVQWLRDGLGIIASAAETEGLARSVPDTGGVYFVPAFVGLGAPYWDQHARGTIVGLTRGTTRAHLARAALEAIAFQSRDVLEAMAADAKSTLRRVRVDGGAVANDFLCQFQADVIGAAVDRPAVIETTGLGAAYLAGLGVGWWRWGQAGPPRLHPVCPVLSSDRLFVLVTPASPKRHDLVRDGRYALQTFPQPRAGSDEFYVAGNARLVEDPAVRDAVFRDAKHMADASEVLFELWIDRVMHTRWEHVLTPQMRPVHSTWRAPGAATGGA